jgi:hypothetical protein
MTDPSEQRPDPSDEAHIESRANLLPEELEAGSADPDEQAAAILEESLDRTDHPERTGEESSQTLDSQSRDSQP